MKIILNEIEIRLAKFLGKSRYHKARADGVEDNFVGDEEMKAQSDIDAAGAELAVCKALNVYPDFENAYATYDLVTRYGETVDVKQTGHLKGCLIVSMWKTEVGLPDRYVLVVGTLPFFKIVGSMKSSEIINNKMISDLGRGPLYLAEQWQLDRDWIYASSK